MRLLVAWFRFGLNGSIGRFVRFARAVAPLGHRVDFVSLTGETSTPWPDLPRVLGPEDLDGSWDAVMVPGAGNEDDPLDLLAQLRDDRFGRRVQHVLNDASRLERFVRVNELLRPDLVVLNNSHWTPPDLRRLTAREFHVLPGAVDVDVFSPGRRARASGAPARLQVGAYARKNLAPVLDALELLPGDAELHLFGEVPGELAGRTDRLAARGRLVPHGELFDDSLATFYRGLDVFVAAETAAGWCNPAAEAMACAVACVATRAGTIDFVQPDENAIQIGSAQPDVLADAVARLAADPAARRRLGERAAASMRRFSWSDYAAKLVALVASSTRSAYYRSPSLGLHGKWDPAERLAGLEPILADARNATVLDLGAAEGMVAAEMARAGARVVHAFEIDADRVAAARDLLGSFRGVEFVARRADVGDWDAFLRGAADVLVPRYDVVLFLGLLHHLPVAAQGRALEGAIARAGRWFALRTPADAAGVADLVARCRRHGLWLVHTSEGQGDVGWLGLFRRASATADASPRDRVPAKDALAEARR